MKYPDSFLEQAHKSCFENRRLLESSDSCACFYCLHLFKATSIVEWIDDKNADTAMCPFCGIDAVIADRTQLPITDIDFLKQMQSRYFW